MKFFYDNYPKFRKNEVLNLCVINLRYIIGLGFLPSGIIKILNRPFTRVENEGVFVDYLDALFTTGYYYNMIGVMQVIAAVLLITQRYSTLGSIIFFPIIFNIAVLTLSTIGTLTPLIATLMLLGVTFLLLWDYFKWINIFSPGNAMQAIPEVEAYPNYSKIHIWTGILIILIPTVLFSIGLPKMGVLSLGLILIAGNLYSEINNPVLRPIVTTIFRRRTARTDAQKL